MVYGNPHGWSPFQLYYPVDVMSGTCPSGWYRDGYKCLPAAGTPQAAVARTQWWKAPPILEDPLHPEHRSRIAPLVVPAIAIGGLGFLGWTVYQTYFADGFSKEDIKRFFANVQAGFIGSMAFAIFLTALVAIQFWISGQSLRRTAVFFMDEAKKATGVSRLTSLE